MAKEGVPVFSEHSTERAIAVRRPLPERLSVRAAIAVVGATSLALWAGLISLVLHFVG
jgi:hypothetical protein